MAVVDARVRVHHPCPYCDVSVEFPKTLLLLWCDNRRDTFLVTAPDPPELRRVVLALRDSFRARCVIEDGRRALVEVPDFEWSDPPSVTGLARRGKVWVLHPVIYYEGTETYRFLAQGKRELNQLVQTVRRLGDVEILSVSERSSLQGVEDLPMSSAHLFEGLTERQALSLVTAYEAGLFHVPARSDWNSVARRAGLSRSTFGEHLRKGQLKLMANSYETLRSRLEEGGTPRWLPGIPGSERPKRNPLQGIRGPSGPSLHDAES